MGRLTPLRCACRGDADLDQDTNTQFHNLKKAIDDNMKAHLSRVVSPAYAQYKKPNSVTSLGPFDPAAKKKASPKPKRVELNEDDRVTLRCHSSCGPNNIRDAAQLPQRPVRTLAAD